MSFLERRSSDRGGRRTKSASCRRHEGANARARAFQLKILPPPFCSEPHFLRQKPSPKFIAIFSAKPDRRVISRCAFANSSGTCELCAASSSTYVVFLAHANIFWQHKHFQDTSRSFMFDKLTRDPISAKAYYVKGMSIADYMKKDKNLTIDASIPGCHRKFNVFLFLFFSTKHHVFFQLCNRKATKSYIRWMQFVFCVAKLCRSRS